VSRIDVKGAKARVWATVALVVAAAAAIAAIGLLGDRPRTQPAEPTKQSNPSSAATRPQAVLVRRRGGVPADWAGRLRRAQGVTAVARMGRTQALLRSSARKGGATVDAPPSGYAFPLDVLVVRPRAYAEVLPRAAPPFGRLRPGTALLSRTSARLRQLGTGDRLTLVGGRTLRVAGVVDDELVRAAELVLRPRDAGGTRPRATQLLVATTQPQRIRDTLPADDLTRVRRFSRTAGASPTRITRPAEVKDRFGEFAVRLPYRGDWIGIEPRWLRRNVDTRSVPILGAVTCHRRFIGPLRRALAELERRGLSRLVDRGDYAGCYAPRRIPGSGSLSLHAWGLAIDLNTGANPPLGASRQDPRLVSVMERAGFTWGGRWPTAPDPMHFELHAVPSPR
jgi:D-alanyl-D-alanine carboxypeptidase